MTAIWSAENRYRIWFAIEVFAAEAMGTIGMIPAEDARAIRKAYPGHARKVMHAVWGTGLLSLTKIVIVVDEWVDVHDYGQVAWQVGANTDPGDPAGVASPGAATPGARPSSSRCTGEVAAVVAGAHQRTTWHWARVIAT